MRFTVDEYSKRFKMSKEMIHSRIKSKRLNYIIEEGVTYIIVPRSSLDDDQRRAIHEEKKQTRQPQPQAQAAPAPAPSKPKTTVGTIIALYQKENLHLKQRIKELEAKIDKLIDDKEQMLRDERDRIEKVYSNKDEQLKTILELVNTKLMLSQSTDSTVHEVEPSHEAAIDASWQQSDFVELRSYLKSLELPSPVRKTIKKRFADAYGSDIRVIQQNGQFYLDFTKYDYSDLLKHS
jgi:ElaB/YqjD/DUF883 family membrane-anchored ribosome-binding protein